MKTERTVVRVSDQMGWELVVKAVQHKMDMRIADFGNDKNGDSPYWIAVDRLVDIDQYSLEQRIRWQASGMTDYEGGNGADICEVG